jgi:L-iditol 2-dehydrogenase
VVVFGAGTIGLCVLQVLRAYGAREIIVVDPLSNRRELALKLGADIVLDPADCDIVSWMLQKFGPDGIDLSFECVGVAATVNTAIRINRKGTRVVVVGVFGANASVSMGLVQDREIELVGTLMYRKEQFSEALWLLESGRVDGLSLVTHRFPLIEAAVAFALLTEKNSGAIKALLKV